MSFDRTAGAWRRPTHGTPRWLASAGVLVAILTLATGGWTVFAAESTTDADALEQTVDQTVGIQRETQQQKNAWATERAELLTRYRALEARVAWLGERRSAESERATALQARVDELLRRLDESARLEGSLADSMLSVFVRLREAVAEDLPFLEEERRARLASVRADLVRPELEPAEKLRRLLEALQIETMYGSSVEVYPAEIQVAGETLHVEVLRLGRLSVFWRTPDGKRAGEFDRAGGEWLELDGGAGRQIGLAMEMATRRRPTEVVPLPLGRLAR